MPNAIDNKPDSKYRILVVDDEQIILSIACDALHSEGYLVDTVFDPLEALNKIGTNHYDFMLTDIKMPNMDGMTLAKEAHKNQPDLGIIFMTGYASLDTAKEAIKTGAYDYIMKPFELNELRGAVAKAVAKKAKLEESSGGQDLKRLSDLMEVLYNVGDRDSLLKLSLGLALLNCNLEVGLIASWDEHSSKLDIAATKNVKEGSFRVLSREVSAENVESCFAIKSPTRHAGVDNNLFFDNLKKLIPDVEALARFFSPSQQTITLVVRSRKQFYVVLLLQEGSQEPLNDRDLKLLSIVLSLISLAAENIALFEESQKALSELEKLHDNIVNLEKIATKGIMSAEIGHELNNFLNIVRSNLEMLNHKAKIENLSEVEKYIASINNCLDQMTKFTSGLADAANLRTEKKQIDLNSLIEDIVAFLAPQKRFRKIGIGKKLDPGLPMLLADPSQLTQLFYNILNNSAQALRDQEAGVIRITTDYSVATQELVIEICDNGPGIPQELVEKVFASRFTTKAGGHGFGLLVCAKVVANHGGKITVKRGETAGTIFTIILPVLDELASQDNPSLETTTKLRV